MAALGGTQLPPYEDGTLLVVQRSDFSAPPTSTRYWEGEHSIPLHELSTGATAPVPTEGQIWPR